jgi:alpha-glucosidase
VEALRADEGSILHLYRRLLHARRASPALGGGGFRLLEAPGGTLAYERGAGGDRRLVLVNFNSEEIRLAAAGTVEVASDGGGEGRAYGGSLLPDQALVLRP